MIRGLILTAILAVSATVGMAQTTQPGTQPPAERQPDVQQQLATPEDVVASAQQLFAERKTGEALDLLKRLLQQVPNHVGANLLAAEILLAQPDLDLARTYFMRVLEIEPLNFRANLGVGKIWVMSRYYRQAIEYLLAAERVAPASNSSEVKRLLAIAYAETGNPEGVAKAEQAVSADRTDLEAWRTLVELQLRPLQDVLRRDQFIGQVNKVLEDAAKYTAQATAAVQAKPWDPELLAVVNDAYEIQMQIVDVLHQSYYVRRGPNITDQLQAGKGTQAADALNRMAELRRKHAVLRLILNEHDNLVLLTRAVGEKYDPKNVKYLENLADTCLQLEDLTARAFGPEVLKDTAMHDQAAEAFRAILEIQPDHERAKKFMAARPGAADSTAAAVPQP